MNEKKQTVAMLPQGITQEMITDFKERYGEDKIKIAELPMDDNGDSYKSVVAKVPSRKEVGEFEKWVDKNPDKAKEILINSCILTSKEEVKANDGLFLAAFDAIVSLIPIRKAILKNC